MTHTTHFSTFVALCVAISLAAGCGSGGTPAASGEPSAAAQPPGAAPAPAPEPATPAPAPAAPAKATAELGKPAPDFTLTDVAGKSHSLRALAGKTVVLEWFNPDCPFVKYARGQGELKTMAKQVMGDSLVWLSINSGAPGKQGHGAERNRAAVSEYGMVNPVLLDENGAVGRAYDAQKTPHLFVIDKQGTLVYRGAIDNAPIGKIDPARPRLPDSKEDELVNYVRAALADMQAERALRLPDTPAYGCSVKYES
jgi:peroxiredoxin